MNINGELSSLRNPVFIDVSGLTFKNVPLFYQAFAVSMENVGIAQRAGDAFTNPGTSTIHIGTNDGAHVDRIKLSADVELDSKPTWAD